MHAATFWSVTLLLSWAVHNDVVSKETGWAITAAVFCMLAWTFHT